jgi:PAS domain S-box-containing protein
MLRYAVRARSRLDGTRERCAMTQGTGEGTRLDDRLSGLAGVTTLPALRTAGAPLEIVDALETALLGALRLAFVVVRLNDSEGGPPIEMMRVADSSAEAGRVDASLASARLGLDGEIGIVVAGSNRPEFPQDTDTLLLDIAANRATIALQRAHLDAARRRADDVRREAERESRSIMDSLPAGIALMAPDGAVEAVNQQILSYFGKTFDELKGWIASDAIHPDDQGRVIERFAHSIATGDRYDNEQRQLRFDGVYRWFRVLGVPLRNTDGNITRWSVLHIDIDERKRAEAARHESERESRLVMENIPGLVATLRPTGEVEFVNDRLVEYCGQPLAAMQQWGTNGTVLPDDLPRIVPVFAQAIASGSPYDFEARIRRFDGAYRWHDVRGLPLRDTNLQIVRWYVLLSDIDDRKRAEDALRESERESRLIVDSIPGLVAAFTSAGEVEYVNRQVLEYFGLTLEALKHWGNVTHPDDLPRVAELFTRSIVSGEPFEFEVRARRFDGVYRWFQSRGLPLRDSNGQIVRWYNLLIDVDERKRAEQELRRSEAFLAQAQKLTQTGSLWWRVSTGEIIWSEETYRLMEYPTTVAPTVELILNRVHPEDVPLVREVIDRLAREGTNIDFEHRLLMPDGSIKHVHVVVQNVWLEHGAPEFVGAITDITQRKRAEADLRRAYDHLTDAQRLSQTGSFTSDLERDEHYWSDEFYRICDFEPGSPITIQRLGDIVHPEDQALYQGAIGRAMAGTDPDFYFRIVTPRGVVKHLRGFAHRIADRPVFVGAVQDVTASKIAQEALHKAGAELAHVSRVTTLSALTASIAHEVNQPLAGILTNASTCLRMLDAAPPDIGGARETARRTIRDGNRATEIIARLRALFSRRDFTLEPLDLNEATREVIALSSNDLQRHRIILQSDLATDLPIVTGDRIQLEQVILNLLRNAADAMVAVRDRPRRLLIKTQRDAGERVRLTVQDSGVGLPSQDLDSLFEPFHTTKSGGMGIGLFVSRSIVERHEGRIWAEPNDGPGASFSFSIPYNPPIVSDGHAPRTS